MRSDGILGQPLVALPGEENARELRRRGRPPGPAPCASAIEAIAASAC
jgi:hypothetical protein